MTGSVVVRDLGELQGEILLFGGCYSNLRATETFFIAAAEHGIPATNMVCTGDVIGYCAEPAETVRIVRDSGCAVIAGNVERQIALAADDCGCGFEEGTACDRLSAGWYPFALAQSDPDMRDWMVGLPDMLTFRRGAKRYGVVHGAASDIARFVWPMTAETDFQSEIALAEAVAGPLDAIVAGHSGIPFERMVGCCHWINAGAIGMPPHDGRRQTRYVVLTDRGARIERLEYDAERAAAAMRKAGLNHGYDRALLTGLWPSEDVLPHEMRRDQGFASG